MIGDLIRKVVDRNDLGRDEMRQLIGELMDGGASDIQKSALLVALRMKGETADEILGAAMAMRDRVIRLDVDPDEVIDTCGTGGDGRGTFNVSTVAAVVAAAAGARVAKHGNRAVSSSCGSADVLRELGVPIDLDAAQMSRVLRETGIAFLFAPKLHPATAAVVPVRRELGVRTIFNILGPLTNPALARRQVMGIYARHLVEVAAEVLAGLGSVHALVVHSDDGLDEMSISAPTSVAEVRDGAVRSFRVEPEDFGFRRRSLDEIAGGDAATNASIARAVLAGEEGAARDIVLLNAGAAIFVAGLADDIGSGIELARRAIDSGDAAKKLDDLASASRRVVSGEQS